MCRPAWKYFASVAAAAAVATLAGNADAQCLHGIGCSIGVVGPDGSSPLTHVGDTFTVTEIGVNTTLAGCTEQHITVTNITIFVAHTGVTNSSGNLLSGPVTLGLSGQTAPVQFQDVVAANDPDILNIGSSVTGYYTNIVGGVTNRIALTATCPTQVTVLRPCISVTKGITNCPPNGATPDNPTLVYVGIVSNCGNTELFNVTVDDALLTPGSPSSQNVLTLFTSVSPGTGFQPGATTNFVGTFVPATTDSTNEVTAIGADLLASEGFGGAVTNTATAECQFVCVPGIHVTKTCENAAQGASIPISGLVTNTGNEILYGVTVYDDDGDPVNKSGISGRVILGPVDLSVGGSMTYSNSYTPPAGAPCPVTNTVFATGTASNAPCGVVDVNDTASDACGTPGTPKIGVTKSCSTTNATPDDPLIDVTIVVTNNGDLTLTNVTVVDTIIGTLVPPPTGVVMAPGDTFTITTNYVMTSCPSTNVVTASGTSLGNPSCGGSSNVSHQDECVVSVPSHPSIHVTKICDFGDSANTNIVFSGIVTNTGDVTLQNISLSDLDDNGVNTVVTNGFSLAPGGSFAYSGSYAVTNGCLTAHTDTVTVSGHDLSVCAVGGDQEVTDTATCTTPACPGVTGCRTTGGGRQDNESCPSTDPLSGKTIRYVTEGGQVGAPFAHATPCTLNDPCISGEWQHVRHMQGGLRGVFHASGNGNEHDFDSLACACLPCGTNDFTEVASPGGGCHPADRVYVGTNALVNGVCNLRAKGQPFNPCGPAPRFAPANKIAFSGIGHYALSKGKKTMSVVFRVDVEDRSEPGGSQPKGGTPPPDRYRIRMWFVGDGTAFTTTAQINALRCAVAAVDPTTEQVQTSAVPDIDDGGDLTRGNHQLHPVTGAVCP